ncbi:MAG: hypothetical protein IPM46_02240 [Flavobacteriales bacterium]|nr:hypothetical protein [Flavobacteriales bacterium]
MIERLFIGQLLLSNRAYCGRADARLNQDIPMPAPFLHIIFRLAVAAMLLAGLSTDCTAQAPEGSVVYRFMVQGVQDHEAAKPLLYALAETHVILNGAFIPECGCFKVAAAAPLDYLALQHAVELTGYRLVGAVEGSDGTVLSPLEPAER